MWSITFRIPHQNHTCITSLRNEKPQFKVALKILYMHTLFNLWTNFLHVQMMFITDLYDCVNLTP